MSSKKAYHVDTKAGKHHKDRDEIGEFHNFSDQTGKPVVDPRISGHEIL